MKDELDIRLESMNVRFESMNKAIDIVKEDAVRVPTLLDRAIRNLHDILQGEINKLAAVSEERFSGVQTQFTLLKQATEQLDLANKTAIAAALQAQKESAGETQKSSQAAIAKSENSTSEAIRTLTATFQQQFNATTERFNDLKERLDRGEGGRGSTTAAWGYLLTAAGVAIPLIALIMFIVTRR